ncbi:MAG: ATP-dependent Clp protease ATP-binding subunit [Acidobacteriota bacterium]|nr:ATP-dependent Clp protease ATP-binding subunit [Acidobacteriota bacterium]
MAQLGPKPPNTIPATRLARPIPRDPNTESWISWGEFIASETNQKSITSGVLAVALEAAGLLDEAGLTPPATRPYWYLAFMEAASKRETEHRSPNLIGPLLAEDLSEEVRLRLVDARPVSVCVQAFRAAAEPVWKALFWGEGAPADPNGPRLRLQRASDCASRVVRTLLNTLVGQTEAVATLKKMAFRLALREKPSGPPPVALFLGPPGVGKSLAGELFAQAMSEFIGHEVPTIRLDMTQYVQWSSASDLWGPQRSNGLLSRVEANPRCLLLVEELEKAHVKVMESFLPVLGTGRFERDGRGAVDFSQAIFIFTSNLGRELWGCRDASSAPFAMDLTDLIGMNGNSGDRSDWSKTAIPRELISRLAQGHLVLFRSHQGHHHLDLIHRLSHRHQE